MELLREILVPAPMGTPLFLLAALPILALGALLLTLARGGPSVATRLTLIGLVIFGFATGIMTLVATNAVLHTGLIELTRRFQTPVVLVASSAFGDPKLRPRLALLRTANPTIQFVSITRLQCASQCTVFVEADTPSLEAVVRTRSANAWLSVRNGAVVDGRLHAVITAAIRDSTGMPVALLVAGVAAAAATTTATNTLWTLLFVSWGLIAGVATGTRRYAALAVTQRVRALTETIRAGVRDTPIARRRDDELDILHAVVDAEIAESRERDRVQNARVRALVDNAPYGICRLTGSGIIIEANPSFNRLAIGTDTRSTIGDSIRRYIDASTDVDALLSAWHTDPGRESQTLHWTTNDAKSRLVRIAGRALDDDVELIAEDVTERQALEAQLQQAQKMEALGQLTGGLAHDFNNLLMIILGIVPLLRASLTDATPIVVNDLTDIEKAAQRGALLIRRLLVFSRADDLRLQPVRVATLLDDAEFLLRRTLPPSVRIHTDPAGTEAVIVADATAVEQMLLNLATNSRDAMPSGGELRIGVKRTELDATGAASIGLDRAGPYHVISVTDTGEGIPAAIRDRVFDPFVTTKSRASGSGLGLSMVYGMMKRHLGTVRIESTEGEGTTMALYFPESIEPVQTTSGVPASAPGARSGLTHVLLVEDEPIVQRITRLALERLGYSVETADDGQQALDALRTRGPFALVITDLLMPRIDGRELIRLARSTGNTLPFILLSGQPMDELESIAGIEHGVRVLQKPWAEAQLAHIVATAVHPAGKQR